MQKTFEEITFKPLKRRRFRCNQTGKVVNKQKVEGYRNMLFNNGKPKPQTKFPVTFEKTYHYGKGVWANTVINCPACGNQIRVGEKTQNYTCRKGHKVFVDIYNDHRLFYGY